MKLSLEFPNVPLHIINSILSDGVELGVNLANETYSEEILKAQYL